MELTKVRDHFAKDGFSFEEDLDLGPARAALYASRKKSLFLYPYFVHCYFIKCSGESPTSLQQVIGYHALACAHTDRFKNKRSILFRLRVPITLTILIADRGLNKLAIEEISGKKRRNQWGNVNAIMLADDSNAQFYKSGKLGFVGSLPLAYTNKLIRNIAATLNLVEHESGGGPH